MPAVGACIDTGLDSVVAAFSHGFIAAAVTQGPIGAVLDARWAGAMAGGARVYPAGAYRAAFFICAAFMLAAVLMGLAVKETRCRNIYEELRRKSPRDA